MTYHLGPGNHIIVGSAVIHLPSQESASSMDRIFKGAKITDIGGQARITRLESSRDRDQRTRRGVAPADNIHLGTADIELRGSTGVVDADLLNTKEILAAGDTLGDVGSVRVYSIQRSVTPTNYKRQITRLRQKTHSSDSSWYPRDPSRKS